MADLLDRLKTTLSDRYAIERELGAGGMATVSFEVCVSWAESPHAPWLLMG